MTITTEAIYEQGVLKLSQPIPLAEGTHVEIIVISNKITDSSPGEILAKIAALPLAGKMMIFLAAIMIRSFIRHQMHHDFC